MITRDRRSIFAGLGGITLAVIVTAALLASFLNNRCQNRFREGLLIYPGAEIIAEEYPFLAMQRVELYSADAPAAVESWYASQRAANMRQQVESGNFSQSVPENWIIRPAADQGGSEIVLSELCP